MRILVVKIINNRIETQSHPPHAYARSLEISLTCSNAISNYGKHWFMISGDKFMEWLYTLLPPKDMEVVREFQKRKIDQKLHKLNK